MTPILIIVVFLVLVLAGVVAYSAGRIAGWADTDARVDEQHARDAVRVQRTVQAEPIRHTPSGWRAS